jgi:hypothetical protein
MASRARAAPARVRPEATMEELIPITMFLCVAAVAILRPISKRLGGLLEAMTRERTAANSENAELVRVRVVVEHVAKRLDLIEERLDFTERLLASSRPAPAAARFDTVHDRDIERIGR